MKRRRDLTEENVIRKLQRREKLVYREETSNPDDAFDGLPDDLLLCILRKLSSASETPFDFISVLLTCRRFNRLGMNRLVLSKLAPKGFAVKAQNWCDSAHRFMKLCVSAGNIEACYTLGMIRFYCLKNRSSGASLMAKAAIYSHAPALYSLAVIQFNGSGGSKHDKDLRAGVALCARAASIGHIDALREVGHCLQDGYGIRRNVSEGRRFLVQANARELTDILTVPMPSATPKCPWLTLHPEHKHTRSTGCPLLSDFGCNVPPPETHPANKFLSEWYGSDRDVNGSRTKAANQQEPDAHNPYGVEVSYVNEHGFELALGGLRLCSHAGCGRPETRRHEYRRCSVCAKVNYCSRACQALDWKARHKIECVPEEQNVNEGNGEAHEPNGDVVMEVQHEVDVVGQS